MAKVKKAPTDGATCSQQGGSEIDPVLSAARQSVRQPTRVQRSRKDSIRKAKQMQLRRMWECQTSKNKMRITHLKPRGVGPKGNAFLDSILPTGLPMHLRRGQKVANRPLPVLRIGDEGQEQLTPALATVWPKRRYKREVIDGQQWLTTIFFNPQATQT